MFENYRETQKRIFLNRASLFICALIVSTLISCSGSDSFVKRVNEPDADPLKGNEEVAGSGTTGGSSSGTNSGSSSGTTSGGTTGTSTVVIKRVPVWSENPINISGKILLPFSKSISGKASDLDGFAITYSKVSGPSWLTVGADGALSVIAPLLNPPLDALGVNAIVVRASNGEKSADASLIVTLTDPRPIVQNISLIAQFNTPKEFTVDSSLISDPFDPISSLTASIPSTSLKGGSFAVVSLPLKKFRYTPPADFRGSDSVTYTVTNSSGLTTSGVINVNVSSALNILKPALAVRASGCIMCHAKVNSNVITDFGFGNEYYFGGAVPSGISRFSGAVYGDHAENWSSAAVRGQVYVPTAPVSGISGVSSLATYLRSVVSAPDASTAKPNIVEKSNVYIGAPTAARILSTISPLAPNEKWRYVKQGEMSLPLSGLIESSTGSFLTNNADLDFVCDGDLVVDKVLFLNSLKLKTSAGGCRIYSTKSVFIQGAITYVGADTSASNLQIVSARAIMLGLGPSNSTIFNIANTNTMLLRLRNMWTVPGYFTREAGSIVSKLEAIISESELISNLRDATMNTLGGTSENNRLIGFNNLMLVAPNIQSRYTGQFKGVIIAEIAIGSLSQFDYVFAPVFETAPVLPLLQESDFLVVE